MNASIITIGNEILTGKTVNTNLSFIARILTFSGYNVIREITVRDDIEAISNAFIEASSYGDLIVSCGGLGPTFDDMTLSGFAKAFNLKLVENKDVIDMIVKKTGKLTPERKKMGIIPENAKPLKNDAGIAPGILIEISGKMYIVLPGVPGEVESIMNGVINELKIPGMHYIDRTFEIKDIKESLLAPVISDMMRSYGDLIYIKSHPKLTPDGKPWVELEISASGRDENQLNNLIDNVIKIIKDRISQNGY